MFADQLRSARERSGITKYRLSKVSGVSESLLSRFEMGKQLPGLDAIAKLAGALNVDFADLKAAADADRIAHMGLNVTLIPKADAPGKLPNQAHAQEIFSELGNMRMVALPMWRVSCGGLMQLETTPDALEPFPAGLVPGADAVMLVEGTSMMGLGIKPGDHLFVRMLDGEIPPVDSKVIAQLADGYTCKVFKRDARGPYLEAQPGDAGPWRVEVDARTRLVAVVLKRLTAD